VKLVIKSRKTNRPYIPHSGQREIHLSQARFRIAICGRRWGKSLLAFMELIDFMVKHPGCLCYWIVPKYKHLIPVSEIIREWLPSEIVKQEFHLQRTFRYIRLKNESQVWFHSSEDPDSLRGPGLDFVILEEAAQLKENVWWEIIKPQLWDTKGRCLMISTPKGKNWLYEEFLRAKENNDYAC